MVSEGAIMTLPLSKTLDPADYTALAEELAIVDRHFEAARPQHPARKWEYSMALRALHTWSRVTGADGPIYDVGGGGSPFVRILTSSPAIAAPEIVVVDPAEPGGVDLATVVVGGARLAPVVFCLSVLEHVDNLDRFVFHLACLTAPGGLLVLTVDYCDADGDDWPQDVYHFHWMRRRIFSRATLERWVVEPLLDLWFFWLGARDFTWHGGHVHDYTFASVALVKRP